MVFLRAHFSRSSYVTSSSSTLSRRPTSSTTPVLVLRLRLICLIPLILAVLDFVLPFGAPYVCSLPVPALLASFVPYSLTLSSSLCSRSIGFLGFGGQGTTSRRGGGLWWNGRHGDRVRVLGARVYIYLDL